MPGDASTALISAGAVLAGAIVSQAGILLNEHRRSRAEARRLFHSEKQVAYAAYINWCYETKQSLDELEKLRSRNEELGQKLDGLNRDWQSEPIQLRLPGGEDPLSEVGMRALGELSEEERLSLWLQGQAISSRNEQFKRQIEETTAEITSLGPRVASIQEQHRTSSSAANAQVPVIVLLGTKPVRDAVGNVAILMRKHDSSSAAFSEALQHFIEAARRELESDESVIENIREPWCSLLGPRDPDSR